MDLEDESKTPVRNRKHIYWKTSINDQRPKLRVRVNDIVMEELLDTGAEVTIITPKSWHPDWPLKRQIFNS